MRHLIAFHNLQKTQPPIDEDEKLALLHGPFTGTALFGGEWAKLQEANMHKASECYYCAITTQIGEGATLERVVARAEDRANHHYN